MSEEHNGAAEQIREQADAIVTQGQDIRSRIAHLVTDTCQKFHLNREGLVGLARSVMEGSRSALDRAVGHDPDSVLRQVVDGLGDGFSVAALAARLTFEEAREQGRNFASEDLAKLRDDLKALSNLFVETVSKAAGKFRSLAADELGTLRAHAEKTRERVLPALEAALASAREHPLRFTGETAGAGLAVSRQALGSLFSALGRRLQEAGQRLSGGERPT